MNGSMDVCGARSTGASSSWISGFPVVAQDSIRILLVEDNDGDVFLVRRALGRLGLKYQLRVACNGEEALRLLNEVERSPVSALPHLFLVDLNLPRVDGTQILARIRRTEAFSGIPVIILTSSDSPKDRETAMKLGASLYFKKPTDLQSFMQLGHVVEDMLHALGI